MRLCFFVLAVCVSSVASAVEWQLVLDERDTETAYAVARTWPATGPIPFDENTGTDFAFASALSTASSSAAQAQSSLHQIGAEKVAAAAFQYDARAEADIGTPHSWGEAGITLRRTAVYKASEAGVMQGRIHAQAIQGISVPDTCQSLTLEIRVGRSAVSFQWYGHLDRWVITGLRLVNVDSNGVEQVVDLGWMLIHSDGFESLSGAPFQCSQNVAKDERVAIEVNINTVPTQDLRAEASTEPTEPNDEVGKVHLMIAGGLINE